MSTDQSELYKHLEVVEYVGDMVGAEKAADQLRVNLVDSEGNPEVDVSDRDGRVLGTVSVDELPEPVTTQLAAALSSNGNDAVRVASPSPLDVSAATVPTEQQTPVGIEDTSDTQIDPAQSISYPAVSEQQDLIASGDLVVGPVAVDRATALVVSASSADGNAWSCSVEWQNADGNTVYTESATDINMDSVTEDYSRLARKGSAVVVTFTDESGASANTINVHANTHK